MALTKNQQNIIGGIGIGVFALFFLMWKVYLPMGKKINEFQSKLDGINQKISTMRAQAQQLDKLQMEAKQLELEVQESEKQLPKTAEMDDLLRFITDSAQKMGIYVQQFSPGKKVSKNYYIEIPIKLKIKTTYHKFAEFLVELSQSERIIAAKDVTIRTEISEDGYSVGTDFTLITYMSQ